MNAHHYFQLKFAITIEPGQMMCSNCTNTINQGLTPLIVKDFADCCHAPTTIAAYDCHSETEKKDTIVIETWFSVDSTTKLAELKTRCINTIQALGFDPLACAVYVNSNEILTLEPDLERGKTKITDYLSHPSAQEALTPRNTAKPFFLGESLKGIGLLTLAGILMALDNTQIPRSRWLSLSIGCTASAVSLFAARHYLRNAIQRRGAMDTLVSLGCTGAIVYSFFSLLQPSFFNDPMQSTFFDVPLMTLGFLRISHTLRKYIENLIKAQEVVIEDKKNNLPASVLLASNTLRSVYEVEPQTRICVLPGSLVPIDSALVEPAQVADINEYFLTGNQQLKTKRTGNIFYAGTLNSSHLTLTLETIHTTRESQLFQTIEAIRRTAEKDMLIEWVSRYFLISVLSIAITSAFCWALLGKDASISRGCQVFLSIMLSACPCGLGLISLNEPMIKLVALKEGILIKSVTALKNMRDVTDICIDKCGTATEGEYELDQIVSTNEYISAETLLTYAITLQKYIPLKEQTAIAKAILKRRANSTVNPNVTNYIPYAPNPGRGGQININGTLFTMGNRGLLSYFNIPLPTDLPCPSTVDGAMSIYCAIDRTIVGLLVFKPMVENEQTLRPDFISTLQLCLNKHQSIHLLTGDDSLDNATKIANQLLAHLRVYIHIIQKDNMPTILFGDETSPVLFIHIDLLPEDKRAYIEHLQHQQKTVLMLGDGENDRPATMQANVGVAMNDQAASSQDANIILNDQFLSLTQLASLSESYRQSYQLSLILAFGMNIALIALSAGVLYPIKKDPIDPMFIGMGMGSSSLILVIAIACWKKIAEQRIQDTREKPSEPFGWQLSRLWSSENISQTDQPLLNYPY